MTKSARSKASCGYLFNNVYKQMKTIVDSIYIFSFSLVNGRQFDG